MVGERGQRMDPERLVPRRRRLLLLRVRPHDGGIDIDLDQRLPAWRAVAASDHQDSLLTAVGTGLQLGSSLEDLIEVPFQELPAGPVGPAFRQVNGLPSLGVELVAVAEVGPQPRADQQLMSVGPSLLRKNCPVFEITTAPGEVNARTENRLPFQPKGKCSNSGSS